MCAERARFLYFAGSNMVIMLRVAQTIDRVNARVGQIVIWLILSATLISALNALVRYTFDTSSNAFLEMQWYLYAWSFLTASGATLLQNAHVRIDVINNRLSRRARIWIDIVGFAIFLTPLCLLVLYYTVPLTIEKFYSGEMSSNTGGLLRWPVWLSLPVGFSLLLLQGWSELLKRVAVLLGHTITEQIEEKTAEDSLVDALRKRLETSRDVPT